MPDNFNVVCGNKDKNITIVCGDSFNRVYNVEGAIEVVFQSPVFNYQILLEEFVGEWNLNFTSKQTQIIEEGSYNYQIKAKYETGEIKTLEEGTITFIPSIFPLYKTYPVVIKTYNPTPLDNEYGVPTLWFNKSNQTLWVLESVIGGSPVWKKTSNLVYIYQTEVTSDFKFSGDTTLFSLLKVTDEQNLTVVQGTYNINTDKTEYFIDLNNLENAYFLLYADKSIEERTVLGTFEEEIDISLVIYKYVYIKDSQAEVIFLRNELQIVRTTISIEQELIIRSMVNQMIEDAKFNKL